MNFQEWNPIYRRILEDFGFDADQDKKSAKLLAQLLKGKPPITGSAFFGTSALIIGPAITKENLPPLSEYDVVAVADSALEPYQKLAGTPGLIFSDLDGNPDLIVKMSTQGSTPVVHAHGDNQALIRKYVPRIKGSIIGTCQCLPVGTLLNFGGFTDGDRAAFFFDALRYGIIDLAGFDFENPVLKENSDTGIKRKKLRWARNLLQYLSEKRGVDFREGPIIRI